MAMFKQNADGSVSITREIDGGEVARFGGATLANATAGTPTWVSEKEVAIAIAGGTDTAGGIFAWRPPEQASQAVVITRVIVNVTTVASAACTINIGPAANATTLNDTLIDGFDAHTATGAFDNVSDVSTNGKSRQVLTSGNYVTGSTATGASAGLVGVVYIRYLIVT